jgi:hypothetical protein
MAKPHLDIKFGAKLPRYQFKKGDLVRIGGYVKEEQGRVNTLVYKIIEEPVGKYAKVILSHQEDLKNPEIHTVYMGRWFSKYWGDDPFNLNMFLPFHELGCKPRVGTRIVIAPSLKAEFKNMRKRWEKEGKKHAKR